MPLIDPMSEEQSDAVADAPGHRCIRRSWPSRGRARLRSMPTGADLTPEAQDEQCEVEIRLLSAAEEINHLTDEARRKRIKIDLRVAHNWQVDLVPPELESRGGAGDARRPG